MKANPGSLLIRCEAVFWVGKKGVNFVPACRQSFGNFGGIAIAASVEVRVIAER